MLALLAPAAGAYLAGTARPVGSVAIAPATPVVRMAEGFTKKDDLLLAEEIERR